MKLTGTWFGGFLLFVASGTLGGGADAAGESHLSVESQRVLRRLVAALQRGTTPDAFGSSLNEAFSAANASMVDAEQAEEFETRGCEHAVAGLSRQAAFLRGLEGTEKAGKAAKAAAAEAVRNAQKRAEAALERALESSKSAKSRVDELAKRLGESDTGRGVRVRALRARAGAQAAALAAVRRVEDAVRDVSARDLRGQREVAGEAHAVLLEVAHLVPDGLAEGAVNETRIALRVGMTATSRRSLLNTLADVCLHIKRAQNEAETALKSLQTSWGATRTALLRQHVAALRAERAAAAEVERARAEVKVAAANSNALQLGAEARRDRAKALEADAKKGAGRCATLRESLHSAVRDHIALGEVLQSALNAFTARGLAAALFPLQDALEGA